VTIPSSEFGRIVCDLSALGESAKIDTSKDGMRFTTEGESANGNILLKQSESAQGRFKEVGKKAPSKVRVSPHRQFASDSAHSYPVFKAL
jgi:hypothetical protein